MWSVTAASIPVGFNDRLSVSRNEVHCLLTDDLQKISCGLIFRFFIPLAFYKLAQ